MPTPWARYKTPTPVPFECIPAAHGLIVTGGADARSAACRFTIATSQIELLDPATGRVKIVPAIGIVLPEWKGSRPPKVELHPFALLHLLVSEPLLREELLKLVTAVARRGSSLSLMSLPTTTQCSLLRQLKASRAVIAFATHYDMRVAG